MTFPRRRLVVAPVIAALLAGSVTLGLAPRDWRRTLMASAGTAALSHNDVGVGLLDPEPAEGALTYLVVGTDRREGVPKRLPALGRLTGEQADSITLWSVQPGHDLRVLAIPRDLRVPVPGRGDRKVGVTLSYGPDVLIAAVRSITGLPIHHYVVVDFEGFAAAIDAVGGVPMTLAHPIRDRVTGLHLPAGPVLLDGRAALRFVRAREPQEFRAGRWVTGASGDLGRIARQQRVISALAERLRTESGLWVTLDLSRRVAHGVAVDRLVSSRDIGALLDILRGSSSLRVSSCTLASRREVPDDLAASPFPPQHDGSTVMRVVDRRRGAETLRWFTASADLAAPRSCAREE